MLDHFAIVYQQTIQFLFGWIDPILHYFLDHTPSQIAMDALWFCSKLYVQIRNTIKVLSTKYVAVKITTDAVQSAYDNICNLNNKQHKEPTELPWGCIATIEDSVLTEKYTHFENKDAPMQEYYTQMQSSQPGIVVIKTNAAVWCNRCISKNDGVRPQSLAKFISVVYKHPDMPDEGVDMVIDREWYVVGNELFSSEFVARWLHYNVTDYVFDHRYTIDILDDQVNVVTLNHKQFVSIEKTTYKIVDIGNPISE